MRIELDKPEILRTRVRAILRASAAAPNTKLRMMFPTIGTIDEIGSVKGLVEEERAKLEQAGEIEVGILLDLQHRSRHQHQLPGVLQPPDRRRARPIPARVPRCGQNHVVVFRMIAFQVARAKIPIAPGALIRICSVR